MKNHSIVAAGIIVIVLTAGIVTAGLTQTAKKPAPRAPAAAAPQAQNFAPGFDDMMTMLVQPRHIKLYYAATAKNWELAAAESRDLRSSFDRIAQGIPNYEAYDVRQAVTSFITPKLDAVDKAIAAANSAQFAAAYGNLTTGCNDCHTYMEHPFLVIKKPDGAVDAAHPDQNFNPAPP